MNGTYIFHMANCISNLIFVQNIHFHVTIDIQGSQKKDALRKNEEKYKKSGMEHWK